MVLVVESVMKNAMLEKVGKMLTALPAKLSDISH